MTESSTRMFEFVQDSSSKFWEVSCIGCDMTTRWGRIGTNGQSKTKTFDTNTDAMAAAEKAVAAKVKKGYVETTPAASTASDEATQATSEAIASKGVAEDAQTEANVDGDTQPSDATPSGLAAMEGAIGDAVEQLFNPTPQPPATLSLQWAGMSVFDESHPFTTATTVAINADFEPCGDFRIDELGILIRGLYRPPGTFIALCQMGEMQWIDLSISNEDETSETWSSQPIHDGREPPWSTLHRIPDASIALLLECSREMRSGKAEAQLSADQFAADFEASYARGMEWRNANPTPNDHLRQLVQQAAAAFSGGSEDEVEEDPPEGLSSTDEIAWEIMQDVRGAWDWERSLRSAMVKRLEATHRIDPMTERGQEFAREAQDRAIQASEGLDAKDWDCIMRLDRLLGKTDTRLPLNSGEVWADQVASDLRQLPSAARTAWVRLFLHCLNATASKPSEKWKKQARTLLESIPDFLDRLAAWLPLLDKPKDGRTNQYGHPQHPLFVNEGNQLALKGLVWCCGLLDVEDRLPPLLGAAAISAYRKIPLIGERATKLGNACIVTIGAMDHPDVVPRLAVIKTKVRTKPTLKLIDRQLDKTAERLNVSRTELEEMSVPTFGLQDVGRLDEQLGDYTAQVVVGPKKSALQWRKADGKLQKSVPTTVKRDFTDELKELRASVKEIDKMLTVQTQRIESLYLAPRSWPFRTWRERYADHPLVGTIARRLLWNVTCGERKVTVLWQADDFRDVNGQPVTIADDDEVTLWHPIDETVDTVAAWRRRLEDTDFSQPFKQAHRELYVLTDAERATTTYSNRFAAHVLKQSQYRSLAQIRQWQVNFLGPWDGGDEGIAVRDVPQFKTQAQFWVSGAMAEEDEYGFSYVVTDQVRFYGEGDAPEPVELADVAPVLFSEIMRDVDLFVGVSSVGNDPNWSDGGPDGEYRDYWRSYSFGELTATAQTRRAVLERLLPRLHIAERCELTDRFLRVEGSLRTYKIHLGSGNILMEPNDQYLCIVTARKNSTTEELSLPFEGDNMFSIILSKAFLLADDAKITDRSITSQIGGA